MRTKATEQLKRYARPVVFKALNARKPKWRCPVCAYHGPFKDKAAAHRPGLRWHDSKCPRCGAVERHRLQSLALDRLLPGFGPENKSLLHVAPEFCLQPRLQKAFARYESLDLLRADVDHQADLQSLPFEDAYCDAVFISRVLSIPLDLGACLDETRRVLTPGGLVLISEYIAHDQTIPQDFEATGFSRQFGPDLLNGLRARFATVQTLDSSDFPEEHQLVNRITKSGEPYDDFPELVRAPGLGAKELLIVCRS